MWQLSAFYLLQLNKSKRLIDFFTEEFELFQLSDCFCDFILYITKFFYILCNIFLAENNYDMILSFQDIFCSRLNKFHQTNEKVNVINKNHTF